MPAVTSCLAPIVTLALAGAPAPQSEHIVLVHQGRPAHVQPPGSAWHGDAEGGFLEAQGVDLFLRSNAGIGEGPFTITAELRLLEQRGSAAGMEIGPGFFGFEGAKEEIFVNGAMFGGLKRFGASTDVFERGSWIRFRATRNEDDLVQFFINEHAVTEATFSGELGPVALRPWRSRMQVRHWQISAKNLFRLPPPAPRGYSIPTIDLADETERQVIVDREAGQYLGHPTTVLLENNQTILCVYPKGHGKGAIVYKRSDDAGLTWSDRLPVPDNWATSQEVPTIYRTIDPQGVKRLILFSGLQPCRLAVSEDDGATWSPLEPLPDMTEFRAVVAMADLHRCQDGSYLAFFHIRERGKLVVYQIRSRDGGLSWDAPQHSVEHRDAHLCEPGIVRSPDGSQLAMLLRENSRRYNSFVSFSDDDGSSWSDPIELPGSLTGDRHQVAYSPDGRLFISFRDRTHESPTHGDWVAWVGRYEDIVEGREGQYRVRLMDNTKGADCAYPGVLMLPDQTIVTTTYGHWTEGEAPYIASVRLKLSELDERTPAERVK